MTDRRTRKKDLTATTIIDTAMEMFDAHGFDQVTMEAIAQRADVAKATLYRYFPTKEAIVVGHFQRLSRAHQPLVEKLIATLPDTRQRLLALYRGTAQWFVEHQHYLRPYMAHRLSMPPERMLDDDQRSGFHLNVATLLEAGQRQGDLRDDVGIADLLRALDGMYMAQVMSWLYGGGDLPARMDILVTLFMDGARKS
ncbi:TetR/AcrR family transcriptional regulator [Magnetospirillum sp. 64-120]|uniref:TetR/AcrR family transcriptional regulator n=1 Tax=Magnetospirillum sp. 64-120 TaxID=1895778 RepID=UPI00092A9F92|nr:TetR/AcrR family transcriptional regulator [Magnetospirillum sp. 64-120]OJX75189.1 MAG: hypothetical protein BGO92_00260 [Magnetospirillum sp. 64-120]